MAKRIQKHWNIEKLNSQLKKGNIKIPRELYQRNFIVSESWKKELIESIEKDRHIPEMYIVVREEEFYLMDGQQRSLTFYEYENSNEYKNKTRLEKQKFDEYEINIVFLEDMTIEEEMKQFTLLQSGNKLTPMEVRRADTRAEKTMEALRNLNKHCVLTWKPGATKKKNPECFKYIDFTNARYQRWEILLQCEYFIKNNIVKCTAANLSSLARELNSDVSFQKRFKTILNKIEEIFKNGDVSPFKKAEFTTLVYILNDYINHYYNNKESNDYILNQWKRFKKDINGSKKSEWDKLSTKDDQERLIERFAFVASYIDLNNEVFTKKDPKRDFTEVQRNQIYYRDNGICQICNKKVEWHDFHADHKFPHSKGGLTTIDNGQCTHKSCNLVKSNTINKQVGINI